MSVKRQIILIPYWIEDVLRRKQLPLATCLDFKALRQLVSLGDLAAFVALQSYGNSMTGLREACLGSLVSQWFLATPVSDRETRDDLSNNVLPFENDASIHKDLQSRLFEGSPLLEHRKEPFICYDLTPEFAGAVINPGSFGKDGVCSTELCLSFVQAMLKVLYVYEPHHEVAKTPLFLRYLSLLSSTARQ